MENVIEIKNLKKYFGTVKAVDDISLNVKKGQLFAFLGLNGAGKSTTINILVGILEKDSGECLINNKSIENINAILPEIGIVFQSSILDKNLSVYENLKYRAMMYDLTNEQFEKNLTFFVENLEMKDILTKPLDKLSGGQKRKVDIARALIHKPSILILDEPTTGLDPKTRSLVWQLVNNLRKKENLSVLLTTHYMEEAVESDFVVIMDNGKIVATGTPNQLKNKYANDYVKLFNYDKKILEILEKEKITFQKNKEFLLIEFKNTMLAKNFVVENKHLIFDLEILKGKMDDVFLNVTGKNLKENLWKVN